MIDDMEYFVNSIKEVNEIKDFKYEKHCDKGYFYKHKYFDVSRCWEITKVNEDFLRDFLYPLEQKDDLTKEDYDNLVKFASMLNTGTSSLDDSILYRVYSLLYRDAMKKDNINEIVKYTYYRAYYEYTLKRLAPDFLSFDTFYDICEYKDFYPLLTKEGKSFFMRCWCNILIMKNVPWQKQKEVLDFVLQKQKEDPNSGLPYDVYILVCNRNIISLLSKILYNDRHGIPNDPECVKFASQAAFYVYDHLKLMKNTPRSNRLTAVTAYLRAKFHSGLISYKELISELNKLCVDQSDYNIFERSTIYFTINNMILLYSIVYNKENNDNDNYILYRSKLQAAEDFMKEVKLSEYNSTFAINYWAFLETIAEFLHYEQMNEYFKSASKAIDKDLYIHSNITCEICVGVCEYLLKNNRDYFNDLEEKDDIIIINTIYNMGLFHKIGLYRLLQFEKVYHRNLTIEEQEIYDKHTFYSLEGQLNKDIPDSIKTAAVYHNTPYPELKELSDVGYKSLISILYLANKLELTTNIYVYNHFEKEDVFKYIKKVFENKDGEFNPELIKSIKSVEMINTLSHILLSKRDDVIYDTYCGDE